MHNSSDTQIKVKHWNETKTSQNCKQWKLIADTCKSYTISAIEENELFFKKFK